MKDYASNGLIVNSNQKVQNILFSTSFTLPLIEYAIKHKFDTIIVHHGVFGKELLNLNNMLGKKLQLLYKHNINLFSYHLPLDAHKIFGNNISLAKYAQLQQDFWQDISLVAKNEQKLTLNQIANNIGQQLNKTSNYRINELTTIYTDEQIKSKENIFLPEVINGSYVYNYSKNQATKIFICSGGSEEFIMDAIKLKCDVMILGEMREYTVSIAQEHNISLIQLGHHRSETTGIQELMKIIQDKYQQSTCKFVSFDNIQ